MRADLKYTKTYDAFMDKWVIKLGDEIVARYSPKFAWAADQAVIDLNKGD